MSTGQTGAPDLITDGCGPPCGCWELRNSLKDFDSDKDGTLFFFNYHYFISKNKYLLCIRIALYGLKIII